MKVRHVMIRASAGAGKTYALTGRYVSLLAGGAAPERIIALTFTRKAAGEFFDEIVAKLAGAAADAGQAARLAGEIGRPDLGPADFLRLLQSVIAALPRLRLGTLDGFFGRIARAFPLELGLAGEFEILQEHAARVERRQVLRRMFNRTAGRGGLEPAQREFIEAFKRATFGAEEKRLAARLDEFLDEHHERFLAAPDGERWGDPARIWPEGCPWLAPVAERVPAALADLRRWLGPLELTPRQRERWDGFLAAVEAWAPGAPVPEAAEYLLKNVLAVWPEVRRGAAEVTVERRKVALGGAECAALAALVTHLVGGELGRKLEATRGIHAVLAAYETVYEEAVRRRGRLTFADVQRLLLPEVSGRTLAQAETPGRDRLAIDYRLDARFDHWLLDEFQDTSFGQWRVLENLIDEVVQDASGERSFFCVGDVKQAIFTWREGDPRLFGDILERYNAAAPGTIVEEHLVTSYRSGPDVIAMVNAVFGRAEVLAGLFPGRASETWNREWREHRPARPRGRGEAAWLHVAEDEERPARVLEIIDRIRPLERGLTCAILVPTNAAAAEYAEYLRREGGLPALAESDLRVGIDNPVGTALLALVQSAAHPGDSLAREQVLMSPLRGLLERAGLGTGEAVTAGVLRQIHEEGFEATMGFWVAKLEEVLAPGDEFSRERGRQLVAAAALFDATGSREVAEFVAFVGRHAVRGPEVAGVVRVMTIHKAKGLGFDVVLLPELEGQKLDQRRDGLAVQRTAEREVEWVLDLPAKLFVEADPVLREHVGAAEAEGCYEALALLYVAFTRARRAMYVITRSPRGSQSRNYPRLLAETLGEEPWYSGDPAWYEEVPLLDPAVATPAGAEEETPVAAPRAPRRLARRPSENLEGAIPAEHLLLPLPTGARGGEFGTAVHALLAGAGSSDWPGSRDGVGGAWPEDALAEARACLAAPELVDVWRRPQPGDVWVERAFEIVLDEVWYSGVFDRVVVHGSDGGRVDRVVVYDFKTEMVPDQEAVVAAVRKHAPQLNLYRRVAAALTGVPAAAVEARLVFTAVRQAFPVPLE